jgi:hypothetical protein
MKTEILALFSAAKQQNLDLINLYSSETNEGQNEFIELKIGNLELVQLSKLTNGWRVVSAFYSENSTSSCDLRVTDCSDQNLLANAKIEIERSFSDLKAHHVVWRTLGIV